MFLSDDANPNVCIAKISIKIFKITFNKTFTSIFQAHLLFYGCIKFGLLLQAFLKSLFSGIDRIFIYNSFVSDFCVKKIEINHKITHMTNNLHFTALKILALVCGFFLTNFAFSQSVNLTGTVQDVNATAISGVQISLKSHTTIITTTSATGAFSLITNITDVADLIENETISFGPNGLVCLNVKNEPVRLDIFNVSGQLINSIKSEGRLNGIFQVYTSAYMPQDYSIYIVHVVVGKAVKSSKFISSYSNASKGIIEVGAIVTKGRLTNTAAAIDSVFLTHSSYKTLKLGLSSYTGNLGIISMEAISVVPVSPASLTATAASSAQINLSWTDNSNNETTFNIERAPGGTTTFTEIATVGAGVTTYQNTGLTASTSYIYRVRAYNSAGYSAYTNTSTAITQTAELLATIRVQNSTKYAMISIKLNGVEQLNYKYVLDINKTVDYTYTTAGNVTYSILVGLMDTNGKTTDFFTYNSTVQAVLGQVTTINCVNPTLGQVLSGYTSSKNWNGYYFDGNNNYFTCGYTFYSNGTFNFYDKGVFQNSGTATLVSWADYATIISFQLRSGETIQMMYPFGSFMQSNGPASWRVITYTKQ